jgi:phosphoglucomutase
MKLTDQATGLPVTDLAIDPLSFLLDRRPDRVEIEQALARMIISASGWRAVFVADGDEESHSPAIDRALGFLVAAAARSFASLLAERVGHAPTIAVGIDTRPTGPTIADIMIRVFTSLGATVHYLFVAAAPEIMAWTKTSASVDAFAYVSASHNPIGHNGFKFGESDGSVLDGGTATLLKNRFLESLTGDHYSSTAGILADLAREKPDSSFGAVYEGMRETKRSALDSYRAFCEIVATGDISEAKRREVLASLREGCTVHPIGIVGELNGSARGVSIDRSFLESLGATVILENDAPGAINHRIVPEGESLDPCRSILERLHSSHREFEIGYVPDNDGDRGNLVYYDERSSSASIIAAQEVFALACVAELAYLASIDESPEAMLKTAIVVNGPTSMIVDRIASRFNASVFRAEVGEANVVGLAAKLRTEGYRVRILGEGSNGGTIIHPSTVRDPLSTISAILKLLRLPGRNGASSPLEIWLRKCGATTDAETGQTRRRSSDTGGGATTIAAVLATLPVFTTTGAYESRAILSAGVPDHGALKRAYEAVFAEAFARDRAYLLARYRFASWRAVQYEGIEERRGVGNRKSSGERGGLKMIFADDNGTDGGFVWMRGSGTEPVFRVLADIEGDDRTGEEALLDWHKKLIVESRKRAFGSE